MSKQTYNRSLTEIRVDLKELHNYWVVVFGSWVTGKTHKRSDIDICILTREYDRKHNLQFFYKVLEYNRLPYDIKVFELLPLFMQGEVMTNYQVVFGNQIEISYYMYKYRKLWNDTKIKAKKLFQ